LSVSISNLKDIDHVINDQGRKSRRQEYSYIVILQSPSQPRGKQDSEPGINTARIVPDDEHAAYHDIKTRCSDSLLQYARSPDNNTGPKQKCDNCRSRNLPANNEHAHQKQGTHKRKEGDKHGRDPEVIPGDEID